MSAAYIVLSLVVAERLTELAIAARNARRLFAAGAVEHGRGHYPLFVVLHAAWLASLFIAVKPDQPILWPLVGVYGLLVLGRVWVIASLGRFWTTRVITLSGAPLVQRGPYRFVRHPNYLVVIGEIALLPLVFGAWQIALVFSLLNLALVGYRIRIEDAALAPRRSA